MKKYVTRVFQVFHKKHSYSDCPSYKSIFEIGNNEKTKNKIGMQGSSKSRDSKNEQIVSLKKKKALMLYRIILDKLTSPFMELLVPISNVTNINDFRTYHESLLFLQDVNTLEEELCLKCREVPAAFDFTKKSLEIEDCVIKSPFDIVKGNSKIKKSKTYKTKCHSRFDKSHSSRTQKSSFLYKMLLKKIIDYKVESMMPNINSEQLSRICDFRVSDGIDNSYANVSIPVKLTENVTNCKKGVVYSSAMTAENILESDPAPIIMAIPLNPLLEIDYDNNIDNKTKPFGNKDKKSDKQTSLNIKSHAKFIPPSKNSVHKVNLKGDVEKKLNMINSRPPENPVEVSQSKIGLDENPRPRHVNMNLNFHDNFKKTTHPQQNQYTVRRLNVLDEKKSLSLECKTDIELNCSKKMDEILTQKEKEVNSGIKGGNNINSETTSIINVLKAEKNTAEVVDNPSEILIKTHNFTNIQSKTNRTEDDVGVKIKENHTEVENNDNILETVDEKFKIEPRKVLNNVRKVKTEQKINTNSAEIMKEVKNEENNPLIDKVIISKIVTPSKVTDNKFKKDDVKFTCDVPKWNMKSHLVSFRTKNDEGYLLTKEQNFGNESKGDLIDINSVIEKESQTLSLVMKRKRNTPQKITVDNETLNMFERKSSYSNERINSWGKEKVNASTPKPKKIVNTPQTSISQIKIGDTTIKNNNIQTFEKRKQGMLNASYSAKHETQNPSEAVELVEQVICDENVENGLASTNNSSLSNKVSTEVDIAAEDANNTVIKRNISTSIKSYNCKNNVKETKLNHNIGRRDGVNPANKTNYIVKEDNFEGKRSSIEFEDKTINKSKSKKSINDAYTVQKDMQTHDENFIEELITNQNTKNVEQTFGDKKSDTVMHNNKTLSPKITNNIKIKTATISSTEEISSPVERPVKENSSQNKTSKVKMENMNPNKNPTLPNSLAENNSTRNNFKIAIRGDMPEEKNKFINNDSASVSKKNSPLKTYSTVLESISNNKTTFKVGHKNVTKENQKQSNSKNIIPIKHESSNNVLTVEKHETKLNEVEFKTKMNELLKKITVTGQPIKSQNRIRTTKPQRQDIKSKIKKDRETHSQDKLELDSQSTKPNYRHDKSSNQTNNTVKPTYIIKSRKMFKNLKTNMLGSECENDLILEGVKKVGETHSQDKLELDSQNTKSNYRHDKYSNQTNNTVKPTYKVKPRDMLKSLKSNMLGSNSEKELILEDLKKLEAVLSKKSHAKKQVGTDNCISKMTEKSIKDIKLAGQDTGTRLRKVAKVVPYFQSDTQNENTLVKQKGEKPKAVNDGQKKNNEIDKSNLKSFIIKKRQGQ